MRKKLLLNTVTALLNQLVTMICAFILPKLLLSCYGSSVNGLISSITQFLSFIAFMELGVGAVVQTTLYRPLANRDNKEISKVIVSAEHFFKKIAGIFLVYTIILALLYPVMMLHKFEYMYTFSMIIIISISSFAQYYFGISYQLLLNADQKSYVQTSIQILTLILNTLICAILMKIGVSILIVKLSTSLIFVMRPVLMSYYVRKNYNINKNITLDEEPIKQKWNGLAQHIASVVLNNTDVVILTLFSTIESVSIYSVYHLVVSGVKQIVTSFTSGMNSLLGSMLVKNEYDLLKNTFDKFELIIHYLVTVCFTCTLILIIPFMKVYTKNINDINYILPIFSVFITMAYATYCIRLPYNVIVLAAGHYKQTQNSAIIEMIINIFVSVLFVPKFGIVGVSIGTLVAMSYRTIYLVYYLKRNILYRNISSFIKHIIVDITVATICVLLTKSLEINSYTYLSWMLLACKVSIIALTVATIINLIAYRRLIKYIFSINVYIKKKVV